MAVQVDLAHEPSTKALDTTTIGGATKRETEYAQYWQARGVVLKAKYRPSIGSYPQWGTGGDRAGKAKTKVPHKNQAPARQRVLLVDAGTGKRRFVDAAEAVRS